MVKDLPSSEAKFKRGITPINKTWRTTLLLNGPILP